jgi:histidinol-phosphate phosphatase family protein
LKYLITINQYYNLSQEKMHSKIIILIGFQASTKSTAAKEICKNVTNSVIVSRDTEGGTVEQLLSKVETHIKDGKVVVVDNTNLTKATRKLFIDLGKKLGVPVDGHYFKTTIEDCQIRHLKRMYKKFGEIYQTGKASQGKKDPHIFGPVVLFKARKDLEEPHKSEGFCHLISRPPPPISWPTHHTNKALFMDIDGTIRITEHLPNKYPTEPSEVKLIHTKERMRTKIEFYRSKGYKLIGLSNQSGIAKGTVTQEQVDTIFERTRNLLGYTEEEFPIMYCPHQSSPITCFCRKPQSGMAMEAIMKLHLNPLECIMVGDMKTDEQMAARLNIPYIDVADFW